MNGDTRGQMMDGTPMLVSSFIITAVIGVYIAAEAYGMVAAGLMALILLTSVALYWFFQYQEAGVTA